MRILWAPGSDHMVSNHPTQGLANLPPNLHPLRVHWVKGPMAVHVLLGWGRVGGGMLETRNQPSRGSAIFSNHAQGRGSPPESKTLLIYQIKC